MSGWKMKKKSKLVFKDGQFYTKKGKLVNIQGDVVRQLNELELMYQQFLYWSEQPKYSPAPTLDGFKFESAKKHYRCEATTPLIDKKRKEALAMMREIDNSTEAERANELLERFEDLITWTRSEEVLVCDVTFLHEGIDTQYLGNPLNLKADEVCRIIMEMATNGKSIPAGDIGIDTHCYANALEIDEDDTEEDKENE